MPLPHFLRIRTARENMEVVYNNLYEIDFTIPANILGARDKSLLLENAKSVEINTLPSFGEAEQQFKFSKRKYVTFPNDTTMEVNISFNLNHDDKNAIYVYNVLKAWYDTVWNSQTGETTLLRNMVGDIIVNHHDKEGNVLRRVACRNCQMKSLTTSMNRFEYGTGSISDANCAFIASYWEELVIDNV